MNKLTEAKRYVRRYFMRPQNIPLSNKDEVLKALIDHEDENCTIYTLNNLGDIKDFNKLTNDDIIYFYDDGILYDKNHVRIMDYNLAIKHEEDRPHINPETTSDAKFADVYADRITDATDLGEALVAEGINDYKNVDLSNYYMNDEVIKAEENAKERAEKFANEAVADYNKNNQDDKKYWECRERVENTKKYIKIFVKNQESKYEYFIDGSKTKKTSMPDPRYIAANIRLYYAKIAGSLAYVKTWEAHVKEAEKAKIKMDHVTEPITTSSNVIKLKAWLIKHITSILFSIPTCSGEPDLGTLNIENKDAFLKIIDNWSKKERAFLDKFSPRLKEDEDYVYRDVMELTDPTSGKSPEKNEANYNIWAISCITKFDISLDSQEVPTEILELIKRARQKSASEGNEVKETVDGNMIASFYLGKALGMIFGTPGKWDISFYKNKKDWLKKIGYVGQENVKILTDDEDLENPLDIDFPDLKNESLHEAVEHKCCICGEEIEGYGNNPEPYHTAENGERCCDACNLKFVIPARLERMK